MTTISMLAGTFSGAGDWYESNGKSGRYTITQTNTETDDGFVVAFKHDFDDGSVVEARFSMVWISDALFRVEIAGAPLGNGYLLDGYCHYHFTAGDAYIQASYRVRGDSIEIHGSSSKNAEGNFIAWRERGVRRSTEP